MFKHVQSRKIIVLGFDLLLIIYLLISSTAEFWVSSIFAEAMYIIFAFVLLYVFELHEINGIYKLHYIFKLILIFGILGIFLILIFDQISIYEIWAKIFVLIFASYSIKVFLFFYLKKNKKKLIFWNCSGINIENNQDLSKYGVKKIIVGKLNLENIKEDNLTIIYYTVNFSDEFIQELIEINKNKHIFIYLNDFIEQHDFKIKIDLMTDKDYLDLLKILYDKKHYLKIKRLFDIFISLVGIFLLLPILIISLLAIKVTSNGPAIITQFRVGLNGKIFRCYKLRTMRVNQYKDSLYTDVNDRRITPVGKILRKFRIDEIPQFINVIKGDMSVIGPRPELVELSEIYHEKIPKYYLRHLVKPGITGWAQVNFRYGASVDDAKEKLCYDLYYIKNLSFSLDLHIILKTIRIVLFGVGAR